MINAKWQNIWSNRILSNENISILEKLIRADWFDTWAWNFDTSLWIENTNFIYNKIWNDIKSIYEVWCWSWAFLYPFHKKWLNIWWLDYSKILVKIANDNITNTFICDEASNLEINKKYDCVISHSVFQYFPSISYAQNVIEKMILKANKKIVILDVNDFGTKNELETLRKWELGEKEYNEKYKWLEHLYFNKDFFYNIAVKHWLNIDLFYNNTSYLNSKYRYNIILTKKYE